MASWSVSVAGANPEDVEEKLSAAVKAQSLDELTAVQADAAVKGVVGLAKAGAVQAPFTVNINGVKTSDAEVATDELNVSVVQGY